MKNILIIWKESFLILKKQKKVLIPFLISGLALGFALCLLYYSPRRPLLSLFGPPIRIFWGEGNLHYPTNLFFLPKLFYYANIFVNATIGVLMTAIATLFLKDIRLGGEIGFFITHSLQNPITRCFLI